MPPAATTLRDKLWYWFNILLGAVITVSIPICLFRLVIWYGAVMHGL